MIHICSHDEKVVVCTKTKNEACMSTKMVFFVWNLIYFSSFLLDVNKGKHSLSAFFFGSQNNRSLRACN